MLLILGIRFETVDEPSYLDLLIILGNLEEKLGFKCSFRNHAWVCKAGITKITIAFSLWTFSTTLLNRLNGGDFNSNQIQVLHISGLESASTFKIPGRCSAVRMIYFDIR